MNLETLRKMTMYENDNEYIIRCGCGSAQHFVHLSFCEWGWPKSWSNLEGLPSHIDLDISLNVDKGGFWTRLKEAFLYVFKWGKLTLYGDVSLNMTAERDRQQVRELVEFLLKSVEKGYNADLENKKFESSSPKNP